jgi:hypothetical protein
MSIQQNIGHYGAKVQSFKKKNPRDLILKLVQKHGTKNRDKLCDEFRKEILKPEWHDAHMTSLDYAFVNNFNAMFPRTHPSPRQAVSTEILEETKTVIQSRATRLVLMDWPIYNGKPLGDCTREELSKLGGWLHKVASRLQPQQKVRDGLTENDLQKIFRG